MRYRHLFLWLPKPLRAIFILIVFCTHISPLTHVRLKGSWYPLGRIVGGTIYPGLMVTAAAVYWVLNAFNITVQIRNVCVLLAPWFASNTAIATYFFTKEAWNVRASPLLLIWHSRFVCCACVKYRFVHSTHIFFYFLGVCWPAGCRYDRDCARLHLAFRRWLVR